MRIPYFLCLAVYACGSSGGDRATTTRDSLGVAIVESRAPLWKERQRWTIPEMALLDVGGADGPAEYQFSQVEGALRLEDGGLVIADGGSAEIRFYDRAGRFVRATGGRGDGPGEYQLVSGLGRGPGDSLWVYDFGLRRFTVLTGDGAAARTFSVGGALSAVNAVGRLPDGSFVVKEAWSFRVNGDVRPGLVRDPVAVVRFSPDGTTQDTVVVVPGREVFVSSEAGRAVMSAPLFAHTTTAVVRGSDIVVGNPSTFEISLYSDAGTLHGIYRVLGRDLRLSHAEIERVTEDLVAREPPERRAATRARYAAMDGPRTRPAYGSLVVDRAGDIWAAEYTALPDPPSQWTVFSADGRLLGDLTMPPRFTPLDIGNDWVLGVWRDSLDVEHVRLYAMAKPKTGGAP